MPLTESGRPSPRRCLREALDKADPWSLPLSRSGSPTTSGCSHDWVSPQWSWRDRHVWGAWISARRRRLVLRALPRRTAAAQRRPASMPRGSGAAR